MSPVRKIFGGCAALACAASGADAGATAFAFELGANAGQPFRTALRIEVTKGPQHPGM